ncbi:MAG: hypothetical protein ACRDQA_08545 [Nocardioidaceae bacterium]
MPTTEFAALPYPTPDDADQVPVDLAELCNKLEDDGLIVFHGNARADLSTTFATAAQGTMVLLNIAGYRELWSKGDNVWRPLVVQPEPRKDVPLTGGFTKQGGRTPQYLRSYLGGNSYLVSLTGGITATDGQINGGQVIANLPNDASPDSYGVYSAPVPAADGGSQHIYIDTDGTITAAIGPSATAGWISLDGIQFISSDLPPQV